MNLTKLEPNRVIDDLQGNTVLDFWSWAFSDLITDINRGVFAEFLVGAVLGTTRMLVSSGTSLITITGAAKQRRNQRHTLSTCFNRNSHESRFLSITLSRRKSGLRFPVSRCIRNLKCTCFASSKSKSEIMPIFWIWGSGSSTLLLHLSSNRNIVGKSQ